MVKVCLLGYEDDCFIVFEEYVDEFFVEEKC